MGPNERSMESASGRQDGVPLDAPVMTASLPSSGLACVMLR